MEDVQAIEDLVDTYLGVEDESDVEEAKATLRDKIETLVEDEEQKETFLAEIDAAEQLEDVQAIEDLVDTYLGVEDESDVEEAKIATLRDKIETLSGRRTNKLKR
ncbi:hypothetical protein [Dolosigranulum savutiense]|uniref:Uncharacterized protein n=1 Tax=Dolosigranulum savutiense TaxID=3110288 RepID=A0AB74U4B4_9LACT